MKVNEINAYRFSDNFTVQTVSEPVNVFGCEHNQQEAYALARWLAGTKGIKCVVVRNSPDEVRTAKQYRPQPLRFEHRETALRETGIWK